LVTRVTSSHNLHTLAVDGMLPLGVECGCGRRALVDARRLDAFAGNMRSLRSLRFVCQACGSRDWMGWLFTNRDEVDAFLRPPSGRPTF
jgi:hypothetical protein